MFGSSREKFLSLFFFFFFFFLSKSFSFVEMTTKFNQEMYAKMRVKKNEPLSNLEEKGGIGH